MDVSEGVPSEFSLLPTKILNNDHEEKSNFHDKLKQLLFSPALGDF